MVYSDFKGTKLSLLGLGTMRLPTLEGGEIDYEKTEKLFEMAIAGGINYFDTAFPYHQSKSEIVTGKILSNYPRESFYLATKFPGHQTAESYDPADVFEKQLEKCGVDYFDFYLLHNVCEKSLEVYESKKWGIIDFFVKQRELGRIKHLGFSSHARPETLEYFLKHYGKDMEFCQIQLNYLDWTLQQAEEKCRILNKFGIPIWVMEPVRGGRLAKLNPEDEAILKAKRPDDSIASWGFRWLQAIPDVKVILSGMSDEKQMADNLKTFRTENPLTCEESELLLKTAEKMKNSLPCTGCGYCMDGCPRKLRIPDLISAYNDARFGIEGSLTASMYISSLQREKLPSACIGCKRCESICPQGIEISRAMADFTILLKDMPDWDKICKERAEAAKKLERTK